MSVSALAAELLSLNSAPKKMVIPIMEMKAEIKAGPNVLASEGKKYAGLALQLLKYMGAGCSATEAAKAAGCDVSYASQLYGDDEFAAQVEIMRGVATERKLKIDNAYEEIEEVLAGRLQKAAAVVTNTDQMLRILKFTNEAKKKMPERVKVEDGSGVTVPLLLPIFLQANIQVNHNNEVIAVDGRSLQTMDSKTLERLVAEQTQQGVKQLGLKQQELAQQDKPVRAGVEYASEL